MLAAGVLAVDVANRWLLAFSMGALAVLATAALLRREARLTRLGQRGNHARPKRRSYRRRAGALLALGPLVGLVCTIGTGVATLTVVLVAGAVGLALVALVVDQSARADLLALLATVIAAAAAVAAGVTFGPTGVDALDRILAFVLIVVVVRAFDGTGNVDGLATGLGAAAGGGLFALAAFGHQDGLATVLAGFAAGCVAFLAFNLRPASLFVGRAGRLVIGWSLVVGALVVQPVPGPWRSLLTPLLVLGVLLLDALVVVVSRLRHRRPLLEHRADHLVHRLGRLGWSGGEVAALLVGTQVALAIIAVFTGRAVVPEWLGAAAAAVVLALVAFEAARGGSNGIGRPA